MQHGNVNVEATILILFSDLLLIAGSSRRSTQRAQFIGTEIFSFDAGVVCNNHKVWKV
jgi:hypothetical protein